eukprot:1009745-Alexandrium_andersonii.AAC.1
MLSQCFMRLICAWWLASRRRGSHAPFSTMFNLRHARTTGCGHRTGRHMHAAYLRVLDARVQAGLPRDFFSRRLARRGPNNSEKAVGAFGIR